MATVKVKFRASSVEMKEGSLYYQVIHNRLVRQVHTGYRLFPSEWDAGISEVVVASGTEEGRRNYLLSMKTAIADDLSRLRSVIARLERSDTGYTADKVVEVFSSPADCGGFLSFARQLIQELKKIGKRRTAETYTTALNSFLRFRGERDLLFEEVDSNLMVEYETFLKGINVCPNSSSFYMRNLRAIYNRAVERELTVQRYPFKHVYTGVDKTVKRAVPLKVIRRIRDLDLTLSPVLDYARDLFMFSFYTRGMAFVDMAYLKRICRTEFWSIAARRRDSSFLSSGRNPCRRLSASTIRPRLLICCRSSGIWIRMPESNTRTPPILSMTN